MKINDQVTVRDDELGLRTGTITGFNHEGYPLVCFDGFNSVVVFPSMIIKE